MDDEPSLGYGLPGREVWTVTTRGQLRTPALFFPTREVLVEYVTSKAGVEAEVVLDGKPYGKFADEKGLLAVALFTRAYFGYGLPQSFEIEQHALGEDHDGEAAWIVGRGSYNAIQWGVEVAGTEGAANSAMQSLIDQRGPWRRGWMNVEEPDVEDQDHEAYEDDEEYPESFFVQHVRFGEPWQVWDLD
jgi:hypothetical protein